MFNINFKEWLNESVTLTQAMQMYGYNPGDLITYDDLKHRFRKLVMKYHPDRNPGDFAAEEMFKKADDGNQILKKFIGRKLPITSQPQFRGQHWQTWQPPNPTEILKKDIKEELNRAITALKGGYAEDAFAAVTRLVDPHMGKLKDFKNPTIQNGLNEWLKYYKMGKNSFEWNFLIPILNNALSLV